jgi:hypothetical protein
MTLSYQIYGLHLRSNRPIPGLTPLPEVKPPDVYVELAGPRSRQIPPTSRPVWPPAGAHRTPEEEVVTLWKADSADGVYFQLRYQSTFGYADFIIRGDGSRVHVTWSDTASVSDIVKLLPAVPLGCVLRLQGITCLHASALTVDEVAIAIVGPKGAGKSTTSAALAQLGHTIFTDDVVALVDKRHEFLVQPGQLGLKLWPDAAVALYGSAEQLPPLWSDVGRWGDKRYLDLTRESRPSTLQPLPLAAIYVLGERSPDLTAPTVSPMSNVEGLIALMANTYADHFSDQTMRARDFKLLSRVAAKVPMRRVQRPDSLAALPQLCDAILTDFHKDTHSF